MWSARRQVLLALVPALLCLGCSTEDAQEQRRAADARINTEQQAELDQVWSGLSVRQRDRLCTRYRSDFEDLRQEYVDKGFEPRIISAWLVSHC